MATGPYAHVVQGPAIVQPIGLVAVTAPRRIINPLIPMCCVGLILFLIASTIILSLIPVYTRRSTTYATNQIGYTALYRLNTGTLTVGGLSLANCQTLQTDVRVLAASNRNVAPVTPTIISCTVTGNSTGTRRRRQVGAQGNQIQTNGVLQSFGFCQSGNCLLSRAQAFIALLLSRGTFSLNLVDANGVRSVFSITITFASITSGGSTISGGSITPSASAAALNDIAILNYALVLERLEASFYTRFQTNFTAQDFNNAGFAPPDYDYFTIIYNHELAHVNALVAIITSLGGSPVPACIYNFSSVTNVPSYVAVAQTLENTGTMAYDGAVNGIADPTLRQTAATIATVEARHAAFLNALNKVSPFPTTTENALQPSSVIAAIQPFIVSCPFTITAPTVPYIGSSSYSGTVPTSNNTNVSGPYTNIKYTNDIAALNYALVAEQLEAAYYNQYVGTYTATDFANANFPGAMPYFILIQAHENAHVNILRTVITSRGGVPVANCSYNFAVTNIVNFVTLSRIFENTGTSAYDGAINTITDPNLIQSAATIATVEARHASFLNGLQMMVPFPNVTDPTLTPAQVVVILSAYQTCPFTPQLPVILSA